MKTILNERLCGVCAALLALFLLGQPLQAQSTNKYALSYTQTTSTFYEINTADKNRLLDFEKVSLKPTTEVRNISKTVDQNNDLTTVINITSSNVHESWMKPPSRIVIDKNGIKMFDAQNAILTQDAYTPEQAQDYNAIKMQLAQNGWHALSAFPPLTPQSIATLQQQGFTVQNLAGGVVQLRKEDTEIKYNSGGMSYELTRYENGKVDSQTNFKYTQSGGRTIPVSKTERNYKITPSGICLAVVTHTTYSNYNPVGLP